MPAGETHPGGLEVRLHELGMVLPPAPTPLGKYARASRAGSLLFVSGTLPLVNGTLLFAGRLGENLGIGEGREASRIAALNALSNAKEYLGSLDPIRKLAKLTITMATTPDFTEHAAVADGASDFFSGLFGIEDGHARMVSGVYSLPKGSPLVTETIFELK